MEGIIQRLEGSIFLGDSAGYYNVTGDNNIAIGNNSGVPENSGDKSNTICIGTGATVTDSSMCRIGDDDIKGVSASS